MPRSPNFSHYTSHGTPKRSCKLFCNIMTALKEYFANGEILMWTVMWTAVALVMIIMMKLCLNESAHRPVQDASTKHSDGNVWLL